MERLMYKYLDCLYPNAYRRKSIFGIVHVHGGNYLGPKELMDDLETCFGESKEMTKIYYRVSLRWLDSLRFVEYIRNSTNNDVLVHTMI
jgi:hypothetical protein